MKTDRQTKNPESYRDRSYRALAELSGLRETFVRVKETDLHILSELDVTKPAGELTFKFRLQVEHYIEAFPEFATSLVPVSDDKLAVPIIRDMMLQAVMQMLGRWLRLLERYQNMLAKDSLTEGVKRLLLKTAAIFFCRDHEIVPSLYLQVSRH